MSSTLVQNHGASSVVIPPSFGGGSIQPSGSVVCGSDPATVQAAFAAVPGGNTSPSNLAFTAVADGQPGELPALSSAQQPVNIAGVISHLSSIIFISTEVTATGSAQNVAHGLGVVPAAETFKAMDTSDAGIIAAGYVITEGAHTNVNVVFTATANLKLKVTAYA